MNSERDLIHVTDTQIGLLGEKYSLALGDGSAFNSYNLMPTYLLLYLSNVISHDFFIHFDQSTENVPREIIARRTKNLSKNDKTKIES